VGTVLVVLIAVVVVVVAVAGSAVLFARRRTRVREGNRTQARADLQQAQQLVLRADSEQAAARMQAALAQRERALAEQRAIHLEKQAQDKIRLAEAERAEATALHQHAHDLAPDLNDPSWQPPTPHADADPAPQQQPAWTPPAAPVGPPTGSPIRDRPAPPPIAAPAQEPPPAVAESVQALQYAPMPAQPSQPPPGFDSRGQLRRTRAGGIWVGLIGSAIVLILLLVFILQNSQTVVIHFLSFTGHLSFAVTMLIAAVSGLLLIAVPGTVRILELGRALKKTARPDTAATTASPQPDRPPLS
jgi:uncharacterized integral membrane protein